MERTVSQKHVHYCTELRARGGREEEESARISIVIYTGGGGVASLRFFSDEDEEIWLDSGGTGFNRAFRKRATASRSEACGGEALRLRTPDVATRAKTALLRELGPLPVWCGRFVGRKDGGSTCADSLWVGGLMLQGP